MPTYTAVMERMTHASATAANLLTNLTPTKTIVPIIKSRMVPYTRKLLNMALGSLVKSPKREIPGAM